MQRGSFLSEDEIVFWNGLVGEYVIPAGDSVANLSARLELCRLAEKGLPEFLDTHLSAIQNICEETADEIWKRAVINKDRAFIRRLDRATNAPPFVSLTALAVLLFPLLCEELNSRPTRRQLRTRVEEWRGQQGYPPADKRTWDDVFKVFGSLLRH